MTQIASAPTPVADPGVPREDVPTQRGDADQRPAPLRRALRFELVKLFSQWPVRLMLLACCVGPAIFVVVVGHQSALPSDTVFGRWMGQTGWAGPLVVLAFACSWGLPLITSLVAGDVFAVEDRLGTWRHLLMAVRSPRQIFVAKSVASLCVIGLFVVGLALSAVLGGLLAAGSAPLVGLDGHALSAGSAAGTVTLAWIAALAPTLAFAAVGLLGSVAVGRSPMGLIVPALFALLLQLAQLLPLPVVVRIALPSYAFIAWRGLFTDPGQVGPLAVGIAVDLVWALVATVIAYRLFLRRDFTDLTYDGIGRRVLGRAVAPLAAVLVATVGVIAGTTQASGSGIDRAKLDRSLATSFAHLYVRQTDELHRPRVTEGDLRTSAACDKGGGSVDDVGPGNDWRCVVRWTLPGSSATGQAIYQLDVTPDGRYVADGDGPQPVNGFFQVRTDGGDVPNPLWQFDGTVDLLTANRRG
ncbi:MAG: ABC transporter permease [Curtobacterium sp.]